MNKTQTVEIKKLNKGVIISVDDGIMPTSIALTDEEFEQLKRVIKYENTN